MKTSRLLLFYEDCYITNSKHYNYEFQSLLLKYTEREAIKREKRASIIKLNFLIIISKD